ncbi:uncharacterized protein [Setaria viridis]|uniref:uncharacterized protein n=1 Tax=Setaria viridis TaxID=4556 RepID=UPI0014933D05|nr:uncharacterized protein LOC117835516 [Setaria viridis]
MRIPRSELRPVSAPFHGVIPGMQAYPLGQIDLSVMFGDHANFRMRILTFEVVDFLGSYHAILGRPCYAKFMANFELATGLANSAEVPKVGMEVAPTMPDYNESTAMSAFSPIEETKVVEIDPSNPTKAVWIETKHSAK